MDTSLRFDGFGRKRPPITFWGWTRKVLVLLWHCLIHFFNYVLPEALSTLFFSFPTAVIAAVGAETDLTLKERRRALGLLTQNKSHVPINIIDSKEDDGAHRCYPLRVFGFNYAEAEGSLCDEDYTYPLYSGHLHTVFGGIVRRKLRAVEEMNYDLEIIRSPFDGCTLYLDWRYADGVRPLEASPFSVHHPLCDLTPELSPASTPSGRHPSKLFRGFKTSFKAERPRRASAGMNPEMTESDEESSLADEEEDEGADVTSVRSHRHSSRTPSMYTMDPDTRSNTSARKESASHHRRTQYARGIIVIIPGTSSDSRSNYIQRYILHAASKGFHCLLPNTRGMGYTPPVDRPLTACGAFVQDIRGVFDKHLSEDYIRSRFGYLHPKYDEAFDDYHIIDSDDELDDETLSASASFGKPLLTREVYLAKRRLIPIVGLGFSLGGAQLTKYLGQDRDLTRVHVGAAVCSPWDPIETANNFVKPFQKAIYHREFLVSLVEYVLKNREVLLKEHPKESVREHLTEVFARIDKGWLPEAVMELDKQITCPIHGYSSIDQYYLHSSPLNYLHTIEVPMLCFTAMDDPVVGPPPHIRRLTDMCELNDRLLFVTVPVGGHLGFMKGPIDEWLEKPSFMEERVTTSLVTACRQRVPKPVRRDITRAPADYSYFQRFGGRKRFVEILEEMEAERTRDDEAKSVLSSMASKLAGGINLPVSINLETEMEELPSLEAVMVQEYAMLSMAATQNMFMYRTRTAESVGGSVADSYQSAKPDMSRSGSIDRGNNQMWIPGESADSPVLFPSETDSPKDPSDTAHTHATLIDGPLPRLHSNVFPKSRITRKPIARRPTLPTPPEANETPDMEDKPDSPTLSTIQNSPFQTYQTSPIVTAVRTSPTIRISPIEVHEPHKPVTSATLPAPITNEPFGLDLSDYPTLKCICCGGGYPQLETADAEYCDECLDKGCPGPHPGGLVAAVRWRWNCQRKRRLLFDTLPPRSDSPVAHRMGSSQLGPSSFPTSARYSSHPLRSGGDVLSHRSHPASPIRSPTKRLSATEPTSPVSRNRPHFEAIVTAGTQLPTTTRHRANVDIYPDGPSKRRSK